MNSLNANNTDIAKYTGYSPTSISRLRSGSRAPEAESSTIKRFAGGVCTFAKETEQISRLTEMIGEVSDEAVIKWLYSDESTESSDPRLFGEHLRQIMTISELSYKELSKLTDTDYTYIIRLKNGDRFPKYDSGAIIRICSVLYDKICSIGRTDQLSKLTMIPGEILSSELLRKWLCRNPDTMEFSAVRSFIYQLNDSAVPIIDININDHPICISSHYSGNKGLQNAIVRFLSEAESKQCLHLYSDAPMDWLTDEFKYIWAGYMFDCLKKGVRIRIVHNVERKTSEMLLALQNWIPLYMTGLIEPYYCEKPAGERFAHTIFINPGNSAVYGVSAGGMECEYSYITDKEQLKYIESIYKSLMSDCVPLLAVSRERQAVDDGISVIYGNSEIFTDGNIAVINRLSEPKVSFKLSHPKMVEAIYKFAEKIK